MATTPSVPVAVRGLTNASPSWVYKSTSSKRLDASAAGNYLQIYANQNATGDTRAAYIRLYGKIAAASGDALRAFYTMEDVAGDTARGAHISLSFGTSGSITGLGTAVTATLQLPNAAMAAGGTYAAANAELYSDGATTDPSGVTELSLFRGVLNGNATGIGRVDDKAFALTLTGGTIGAGNIVEASTTEANYAYSIRCSIMGTTMYLMCASAVG